MILIDAVMPQQVASTAAFVASLSHLVPGGITYPVEQLVLRYFVDHRDCSLCGAVAGYMCNTMGSQNLRRTHPERLARTDLERQLAVEWALLEYRRQQDDWHDDDE